MRWALKSATQRVPSGWIEMPTGPPITLCETVPLPVMKSALPRTPLAAAPLGRLTASSKRKTRLLEKSPTQRVPSSSIARPIGALMPVAERPAVLLVKLGWPKTASALDPLVRAASELKRRTRLLSRSLTKSLPEGG